MKMRTTWILSLIWCLISNGNCFPKVLTKDDEKTNIRTEHETVDGDTYLTKTLPWQVGISVQQQDTQYIFRCGGSLISKDVVMTAAHCLQNPIITPSQISVRAGDRDRGVAEGTEQTRDVVRIKLHPNYTGTLSSLYNNDIALLKLTTPFISTSSVSTIMMTSSEVTIDYTASCYITGWGVSVKETSSAPTNPSSLLTGAEVRIMTNDECNTKNYWDGLIKPSQICAFNKRVSACLGDSGGPLVCEINHQYIQYGITSWGTKSCDSRPSVFTHVAYYTAWIQQTLTDFNQTVTSSKLTDAFAPK